MRSFNLVIIVSCIMLLGVGPVHANTLFQARGLHKGKCYQEMASLICEKSCTLDLFPMTAATIALSVKEIRKEDRMTFGRLFDAKFKILNTDGNQIKILELRKANMKELKSKVDTSNGLLTPTKC